MRAEGSTCFVCQRRVVETFYHEIERRHAGEFGMRHTECHRTVTAHVREEHLFHQRIGEVGFVGNVVFQTELIDTRVNLQEVEIVGVNLIDEFLNTLYP